jgi:hypothetical protein
MVHVGQLHLTFSCPSQQGSCGSNNNKVVSQRLTVAGTQLGTMPYGYNMDIRAGRDPQGTTNQRALDLENQVRRNRNPDAATRQVHD